MNFAIANPARQVFFTVRRARGEVQGQEPDRRRDLSRLRCVVRLGLRQPAGARTEARRHRAVRAAGGGRLAGAVGGAGTRAGTSRRTSRRQRRQGRAEMTSRMTRRDFAALAGAAAAAAPRRRANGAQLLTRAIPGSGERLPAVGLGTAYVFDRRRRERPGSKAAAVVQALIDERRTADRHRVDLWRCRERARRGRSQRPACATSSSSPPSSSRPTPPSSSARWRD